MDEPRPAAAPTDQALLRRFRSGDEEAAARLYRRYAGRLRALVRSQVSPALARCVDPEDVVQSVFATFFQGARRGRYDVPADGGLWKLLLVLALNKVRSRAAYHYAARRDLRLLREGRSLDESLGDARQEREAAHAFLRLALDDSLGRLPPEHGEMVRLRLEGYEVAEIAARTGRSHRTVERCLQASRRRLGDLLGAT